MTSRAGKTYRILISWPASPAPSTGYSVTYVLDGDDLFPVLTSTLRLQAGTEKSSRHNAIQPGIIVAIGYSGESQRHIDYTPEAPAAVPETYVSGKPYPAQESGGAAAFYKFLQEELKPVIEKDYSVDTSRQSILGNGYGGLFVLHTLYNHPSSFQTYIASSPSIWWNGRYILQEEKAFTEKLPIQPMKARLLITVGDLEQSLTRHEYSWPETPREEHLLKVTRRRMVDNTRELFWRLEPLRTHGLEVSYRVFEGESHKSVVPIALSYSLPFIFPPAKVKP